MLLTYLQHCHPSTPFYERRDVDGDDTFFPLHREPVPVGWTRRPPQSEWVMYAPDDAPVRWQGWKIHVGATIGNAEKLLDIVASHCLSHDLPFKALTGLHTLIQRNSKYADRGGSGKFITLYPGSDEILGSTLRELDELIGGEPSPTILSDLRYNEGPLFVRYGAFRSRQTIDEAGRRVECIEDPDGNLVPDERRPGFHPPAWATIPAVLEESLVARSSRTLADFPYRVRKALHFSNGGGVYLAQRPDHPGQTFLLKEARPYCGLDESGQDAIARLERERDALDGLAGLPGIPAIDAYVDGVEHKFLGRAYVEGKSLMDLCFEHNPQINAESTMTPAEYARWGTAILDQVTEAVTQMHARGWVFGDLHPGNIIIDDTGRTHFIDFESASRATADSTQTMGVVGFRAPAGYSGTAVDRYALGSIRIALFLPLTRLLSLGPGQTTALCRAAQERFDLPADFFDGLDEQLGRTSPGPASVAPATDRFTATLANWRTADRDDRLYPGDVRQFLQPAGGLALGYGAAGVLWASHQVGETVQPEDLAWLRSKALVLPDAPVGFWGGLAGIAYAVEDLDPDLADACLRRAIERADDVQDLSLDTGLSGLGVHLLRRSGHLETAAALMARVTAGLDTGTDYPSAGLFTGAAGLAVFALRASASLNDPAHAELATRLLELEVSRFGVEPDATPVPAAMPAYGTGIGTGALGLALALHDHQRITGSDRFTTSLARIVRYAQRTVAIHGGLLNGRAGQIQTLLAVAPDAPASQEAIRRCDTELDWYLTELDGHTVSLGDESLKASLDLGTGFAGLLLTRQAVELGACTLPLWR